MMMKLSMTDRKMVELDCHQRMVLLESLVLFERLLGWAGER